MIPKSKFHWINFRELLFQKNFTEKTFENCLFFIGGIDNIKLLLAAVVRPFSLVNQKWTSRGRED